MSSTLYYTNILTPYETIERGSLVISDEGKIAYVGALENAPRQDGRMIDLRGLYVAPGFIDIHVHGGKGITFGGSRDAAAELKDYSEWVVSTGVTGFLTSIAAPDLKSLVALVHAYAQAMEQFSFWNLHDIPGAEPLGIHLEGPYLNPEKKGAFNPQWLRKPALDEVEAVLEIGQGWIRQVTMAPELPGAPELASIFRAAGVVVSMGHTSANYATASAALRGNFTHVTHTFNAQSGFHHREPGVFGAILTSDFVTAELIADGVHAHPGAMKILTRCLGADRITLITDAMAGAGLPDGAYDLVGQQVTVRNGIATVPDGTLAGSTAAMNQCVHNMTSLVGLPLQQAVQMASLNPARTMGFASRLGSIQPGKDASLTVIDQDANVYLTLVKGRVVYSNL